MLQLWEKLFFIHHWVHWTFTNNAGFWHFFQSEKFALFSLLHFPDFAKPTSANNKLEVEVIFVDRWNAQINLPVTASFSDSALKLQLPIINN